MPADFTHFRIEDGNLIYPEFASWKFENRVSAQARVRFPLAGFIIFSDYISERIDG